MIVVLLKKEGDCLNEERILGGRELVLYEFL